MHIKADGYIEKAMKLAEGEVEFVVSTNALDSYGERINVEGINLKDYKRNPVVLWGHDGYNLPIAKATKVWKESGKLMARAKFYLKDEFSRKVYDYIVDGFLNAVSIGGMIDEWGADGMTIEKLTMKEFSVVSIPANPEALATAKSFTTEQRTELNALANEYARKMIAKNSDSQLINDVKTMKRLVATLEEIAVSKYSEPEEVTNGDVANKSVRVMLETARAVDTQAEKIIISLKGQKQ